MPEECVNSFFLRCAHKIVSGPPCLFQSVPTGSHKQTERKKKVASSPSEAGTLRQLLWMAEKQWSTFRPPVKRRCQAAGAWRCYTPVVAGRGGLEGEGAIENRHSGLCQRTVGPNTGPWNTHICMPSCLCVCLSVFFCLDGGYFSKTSLDFDILAFERYFQIILGSLQKWYSAILKPKCRKKTELVNTLTVNLINMNKTKDSKRFLWHCSDVWSYLVWILKKILNVASLKNITTYVLMHLTRQV